MNIDCVARALGIFRVTAIVVGGAVTLWVAIGVTLNFTLARQNPSFAAAWWPAGVTAKVVEGRNLLTTARLSPALIDSAWSRVREAALREPANSYALSTLGALADYRKEKRKARIFFRLSEAMSRRNLLTEFWLIEDAVGRDNIRDAIIHYDRAMRVSVDSRATLLPILVSGSSESEILKELLPILAQRPIWWKDYLQQLAAAGSDTRAMAASVTAVRPDLRDLEERVLTENILRRMLTLKDEHTAITTANLLEGRPGQTRSLHGGNFEAAAGVLPFTWWLQDDGNTRAFRDTVPDGSTGLWITTSNDTSAGVAQQLIGLASGRYFLSGRVGDVQSDLSARPAITISCGEGTMLNRFVLPPSDEKGRSFHFTFDVPLANCRTQWVTIVSGSGSDTRSWIDNLAILR